LLGHDFNNTVNGAFTSSNGAGEVSSNNQGVLMGAFFCSLSKAAVDAQVAPFGLRLISSIIFFETATQEDIPINTVFPTGYDLEILGKS
jgi:hypothetical protein